MPDSDPRARIKQAELIFFASASRLLDKADEVRRQRDGLLELIAQAADRRREAARGR